MIGGKNTPLNPPQRCRMVIDTTVSWRRHRRSANIRWLGHKWGLAHRGPVYTAVVDKGAGIRWWFQLKTPFFWQGTHKLEYIIYTDAALRSLKSFRVSSKLVKECLDLLVELTSYFTINLQWVPGHSDIPGNCEADELARTTLQLDSGK